jgi:DNA-binding NtrC family response regulator
VRILCFVLPPIREEVFKDWLTQLENLCPSVTVVWPPPKQVPEEIRRAMWRGEPFLIAGSRDRLLSFLNRLDPDSVIVLKDFAYCWFLSDSHELTHASLPAGRQVLLNWASHEQNIVRDALEVLTSAPGMKGLSASTDRIRRDIRRVAEGLTGPSRSVLILAPSGCGKELVFRSLVAQSDRKAQKSRPTGGAWLNMEPGMAMTELVGLERVDRDAEPFPGLLKLFSNGTIFIDDFESAPKYVQETLLRVMEDEKGEYFAVGGKDAKYTNAWLLFATNRNLDEFLTAKDLRPDFLYRFGTRIISIPPLIARPADIPAIARTLWDKLWQDALASASGSAPAQPPPLRSDALRRLLSGDVDWGGNTRTLRTALDLVVSMMRDPVYNGVSQADLVGVLLARGPSPIDWLQVLGPKTPVTGKRLEEQILYSDGRHPRVKGPSSKEEDPLEDALTRSESQAKAHLTPEGWRRFRQLCRSARQSPDGTPVRVSVRMARIIWYVALLPLVNWKTAHYMTTAAEATVNSDLKHLAGGQAPLLRLVPGTKPPAYERIPEMFV